MTHSLPVLRIASPCPMKWDDLTPIDGQPHRRSCAECGLHVHNFAAMSPDEIQRTLADAHATRVCAAAFARPDGTVILQDCPVGLRAARRRLVRSAARVAALIAFACTGTLLWASGRKAPWQHARLRTLEPFAAISAKLDPAAPPSQILVMGDICVSPPQGVPAPPPTPPQTKRPGSRP